MHFELHFELHFEQELPRLQQGKQINNVQMNMHAEIGWALQAKSFTETKNTDYHDMLALNCYFRSLHWHFFSLICRWLLNYLQG